MLILCIGVLLVKVIYYFSWIIFPKYSNIQNGKIFYLQKMSQPIKKRQIKKKKLKHLQNISHSHREAEVGAKGLRVKQSN